MRKMNYTKRPHNSESGVALIFALAFLALLLIMLVGFLACGILEQRIAYNQSSQVGSKLLARSALIRVKSQLASYGDVVPWMRYRPEENETQLLAPLVSTGYVNNDYLTNNKSTQETEAYQALKPLLKRYVTLENWFPAGVKLDYPEWINYTISDGENRRLTGRLAYAVLPNLGIEPALMTGTTGIQNGKEYDELSLLGLNFMTATSLSKLKTRTNWLSLDVMTGYKGAATDGNRLPYSSNSYYNLNNLIKNEFRDKQVMRQELANFFFTSEQLRCKERAWDEDLIAPEDSSANRVNLNAQVTMEQATDQLLKYTADGEQRRQIAANLVDYIDADSVPTSDIAADSWYSSATQPQYTGNEKTAYINQVVPAVELQYAVEITRQSVDESYYEYTYKVTCNLRSRAFAELINIYNDNVSGGDVTLKNLLMKVNVTAVVGGWNESREISFDQQDVNVNVAGSLAPHSYKGYCSNLIQDTGAGTLKVSFTHQETVSKSMNMPKLKLLATLKDVSFDRVLFKPSDSSYYADYVHSRELSGNTNAFCQEEFSEGRGGFQCGYWNLEATDPRCNLQQANWRAELKADAANLVTPSLVVPNWESQNAVASARNTDVTKAQDLEPLDDPAYVSTGYIRNAPMESVWELGLIHRGASFQTLNLKNALNPGDSSEYTDEKRKGYWNDAQLLDRAAINPVSQEKHPRFNINMPSMTPSAFGPLVYKVKYHAPNSLQTPAMTATETLSSEAAYTLQQWIANKCYNVKSGNPALGDTYARYIHRGMLANVITDWAVNCNYSPYKSVDLRDAQLEEIIGKITPLTRCGDAFEYFTVFVVAQSIKDLGSTGGPRDFVRYDADGNKLSKKCKYGIFDEDFDEVTGTTYLVARVRREIDQCKNTVNCRNGIHDPTCTFKLKVLEAFTLEDLE